jgi:cob(I)alamin adenosyltransferase
MKRKLGKTKVNPLDLLLDTTSNVFGSMILIAIMIALFSGNPSATNRADPGEVTSEAIDRQIRNAEKDASVLAADLSKLKSRNGEKVGARDLAELENDIDSLKRQLEGTKKIQRDGIQDAILDYGATVAGSTKEAAAIEEETTARKNAISTDDQQIASLKDRIDQMQAKVKKERSKKVQRLSLPKEHDTDMNHMWVVLINNQVYPAKLIDSSGEMTPFSGIKIMKKNEESNLWIPQKGAGFDLARSKGEVVELIRRLPRDHYVTCIVFPDSIQCFRDFEEIVHGLGREMGWQPCDQEQELIFSTKGSYPKPQ